MLGMLVGLAFLSCATGQESEKASWRTDPRDGREAALWEGRPCVLFLYVDSM